MHPAIVQGEIPRGEDVIDPQIAGARIGPIHCIELRLTAMLRVGRCAPARAGRLWILQLGMGQKPPHHLMVPLAIKGIKVGIGQ